MPEGRLCIHPVDFQSSLLSHPLVCSLLSHPLVDLDEDEEEEGLTPADTLYSHPVDFAGSLLSHPLDDLEEDEEE